MEEKIKKKDLKENRHVSNEDIQLRKFCVEMAATYSDRSGIEIVECARMIERYITDG